MGVGRVCDRGSMFREAALRLTAQYPPARFLTAQCSTKQCPTTWMRAAFSLCLMLSPWLFPSPGFAQAVPAPPQASGPTAFEPQRQGGPTLAPRRLRALVTAVEEKWRDGARDSTSSLRLASELAKGDLAKGDRQPVVYYPPADSAVVNASLGSLVGGQGQAWRLPGERRVPQLRPLPQRDVVRKKRARGKADDGSGSLPHGENGLAVTGSLFVPHAFMALDEDSHWLPGWQSYFLVRGLLAGQQPAQRALARDIVDNLLYEVKHYGHVLGANTVESLPRPSPPYLSEMVRLVFEDMRSRDSSSKAEQGEGAAKSGEGAASGDAESGEKPPRAGKGRALKKASSAGKASPSRSSGKASHDGRKREDLSTPRAGRDRLDATAWLRAALPFVEAEYATWTERPYQTRLLLSRYHAPSTRAPEEHRVPLASGVYDVRSTAERLRAVRAGFASGRAAGVALRDVYDPKRRVLTPFFYRADASARAYGLHPSHRFGTQNAAITEHVAVDLNVLLWLSERNLAYFSKTLGKGKMAGRYLALAKARAERMRSLLWDADSGLYLDYHLQKRERTHYPFLTSLWPMWAGLASKEQAAAMVENLRFFEEPGGLQTSTIRSGDPWDAPYGWPHMQLAAVEGLRRYGFKHEADRITVNFLTLVLRSYLDDKTLFSAFDVVQRAALTTFEPDFASHLTDVDRKGMQGSNLTAMCFSLMWKQLSPEARARMRNLAGDGTQKSEGIRSRPGGH